MSHLGSSVNESQNAWYCKVHHPISHGFWLDPIPISWLQCDMNYGLQPDIMMVKSYYRCWIIKSMMVIQKKLGIKTRIKIIGQNHVIQIFAKSPSHFMVESLGFPWLNPLIGTRPGLKHFTAACQLFTTRLARLRNASRSRGCETGTCARVRQGDNRAAWGIQGILVADFHGKIMENPTDMPYPTPSSWMISGYTHCLETPQKWGLYFTIFHQSTWIFWLVSGLKFVSHWISMKHFSLISPSWIWIFHHPQLRSWFCSPWMPSSPAHHTLESITTWQPSRKLPKTWVWGGRWIYGWIWMAMEWWCFPVTTTIDERVKEMTKSALNEGPAVSHWMIRCKQEWKNLAPTGFYSYY